MAAASSHWLRNFPVAEVAALGAFLAFIALLLLAGQRFTSGLTLYSAVTGVELGGPTILATMLALASLLFAAVAILIAAVTP